MCGLVIDTMVLMALVYFVTGEENGGWFKPLLIAVLSGIALYGSVEFAATMEQYILLILFGSIFLVSLLIVATSWILLDLDFKKGLIVGGGFMAYKVGFTLLFVVAAMATN